MCYPSRKSLFLKNVCALAIMMIGLAQPGHAACTVDDKLVNSCRPWFTAAAGGYPEAGQGTRNQISYLEQRLGKQVDIVHTYHAFGKDTLTEDEIYYARRPNTYLATTWKPTLRWKDADGSNPEINASIDRMALSIKAIAPARIFFSVFHEPENDVSGGVQTCDASVYKGDAGTADQYRAMWKNVRSRFDRLGVKNVVWVMNYMGFDRWQCMVNALWPGNDLVDWIVWDAYENAKLPWPESPLKLYNFLAQNSNAEHNYLSKPWGVMETGVRGPDTDYVYQQYKNMALSLDNNTMPRLKMLAIWDNYTNKSNDFRVGYNSQTHQPDPKEQDIFNAYARDPRFTDTFYEK